MDIITRRDMGWPATKARKAVTNTGLVIHYDGAKKPRRLAEQTCGACRAYWAWCRRYHMNTNGWLDVGYCAFVCPHGNLYIGRDYGHEQAAQPGGNQTWASVTLGLGKGESPTEVQIESVRRVRQMWMQRGMKAAIRCHSDFISTDCPGDPARKMVRDGTFAQKPKSGISTEEWTVTLIHSLPTLGILDNSYDVKSVRALLFARGVVKDIPAAELPGWLNITKYDADLRDRVTAFQQMKFQDRKEWDGIVGRNTWEILMRV